MTHLHRFALPLTTVLLAACASFPPGPAVKAVGYSGAPRIESEVATVFITDGRPNYESGFICSVDGKPATSQGGCASIIYLLPGAYRIGIRYQSRRETGEGQIGLRVEAGRLYQLNATSFQTNNRGMISVIPMPVGSRLVYRNVAPNLFPAGQLDTVVPYGER